MQTRFLAALCCAVCACLAEAPADLERQADAEVAAARQAFDARNEALQHAKQLVEHGALARLALTPYVEEFDRARRALDDASARAALLERLVEQARAEAAVPATEAPPASLVERYGGDGFPAGRDLKLVERAFETRFARRLPVSARGSTTIHRALGFDHRGRVDVALDPDEPQGAWLRRLLEALHIPYYAFRAPVAGRATGPHIHIGPPSERISRGG